jgi:GAF domain-containing protein
VSSTSPIRFLQQESARLQRENKALQEKIHVLQRYIDALAELHRAAQRMADEESPLDLLSQCILDTMAVVGAKDGSVSYLDRRTDELVFTIVHGMLKKMLMGRRIRSDVGVMGWVVENGETVIVNEPRQDWRFSREIDDEFSFLTRSIMCAPIVRDGEPIGVVELLNKEPQKFDRADATLLAILCDVAAAALTEVASRS